MTKLYKADLESSKGRLLAWKNGKVSTAERRILMTKWLGISWEEYCKTNQKTITNAFKRCGMYNALDGSESHLIKIRKYAYTAPAKEDKPEEN